MKAIRTVGIAAIAVFLLAGCGATSNHNSGSEEAPKELAAALANAQADPLVDKSQLDILSGPSVTFELYEKAIKQALSCAQEKGVEVHVQPVTKLNGIERIPYYFGGTGSMSDEQAAELFDSCFDKYAEHVDTYWQVSSPQVQAFETARAEALYIPLRECVTRNGADIPEDASFQDLMQVDFAQARERADAGGEAIPVCLEEIGYSQWQG